MKFELHPQLEKDLIFIGDLKISKVMLLPDSENPWIVLVPRVANIKEFFQLSDTEQKELVEEMNKLSSFMSEKFESDKMNIGMLGNMVPQLHVHIICRYKNDRAWPGAIWGSQAEVDEPKLQMIQNAIAEYLNL